MTTVREASFELFRAHGMTRMFGNPGSTELPMLADWPDDFSYVLGLQEAVVVGMADGFAQASGRPTLVNLHTAPGVGNAMGAIFNAQANHSPLLITAGQQVRPAITMQANLTNRDAIRMTHPLVKWSYEPPFVSVPMDDWEIEVADDYARAAVERRVVGRAVADPAAIAALARRLEGASNPVLIAGPDIDASGGWDAAVALAERQRLAVFAIPAPGGGRLGFPEGHPNFRGVLPPAIGPVSYMPGPLLPENATLVAITSDPDEAARAPMGEAILADVKLSLEALVDEVAESDRDPGESLPEPVAGPEEQPITGTAAMHALAGAFPDDGIVVLEAPSATLALRNQLRISRPGSYYFCAGGGLGYGLAAAVGVQLAEPDRPVVCVVGEGSVQYAVTAFWSAVANEAPVTFLVLRNDEYAILKWFSEIEGVSGAPGLDLPGLDTAAIATGYGVGSVRVRTADELREALAGSIAAGRPELVEVGVAPGMWLF